MPSGKFNKIRFGAGFAVYDEGGDIIRVTSSAGTGVAGDTIWDSRGDLAAGSGSDAAARLPVGTDGQTLVADSSQPTGLRWATAPAGGGASPADTAAWLPLTTTVGGDDVLVFDADHSLVPTLIPF